jgi:hypothetical protein
VFALVDLVRVETSGSGFAEAGQEARFGSKRSDARSTRCVGVSRFRDKLLERGASGELYRVRVDVLHCRSGQRRHELEDPALVASWIDF